MRQRKRVCLTVVPSVAVLANHCEASDDSGNRNNVVHVKPATRPEGRSDSAASIHSLPAPVKEPLPDGLENTESPLVEHEDDHVQVPSVPLPYVAVETVPDQAQPAYGLEESQSLNEDASKRTADADPDTETVRLENVGGPEATVPDPPLVPVVVVEKADLEPSFGDDFGGNATHAQKIAHDLRTADAPPDNVIVSSDAEGSYATYSCPSNTDSHRSEIPCRAWDSRGKAGTLIRP